MSRSASAPGCVIWRLFLLLRRFRCSMVVLHELRHLMSTQDPGDHMRGATPRYGPIQSCPRRDSRREASTLASTAAAALVGWCADVRTGSPGRCHPRPRVSRPTRRSPTV